MAARTRARRSSETNLVLLRTCETVLGETRARCATSRSATMLAPLHSQRSGSGQHTISSERGRPTFPMVGALRNRIDQLIQPIPAQIRRQASDSLPALTSALIAVIRISTVRAIY